MKAFIINSKLYDNEWVTDSLNCFDITQTNTIMKADFIICIGGDASVLKSIRYCEYELPVFGINTGTLGFLSNEFNEFKDIIDNFVNGYYDINKLNILKVKAKYNGKSYFLNEVSSISPISGKLTNLDLFINNEYVTTYKGDGVVFSTSTGSTAWGLSAGGSIISPEINCINIVPNNPFSLNSRPLIIPSSSKVVLKGDMRIIVDGYYHKWTKKITIKDSKKHLRLVKLGKESFYERIRSKLGWGNNIK